MAGRRISKKAKKLVFSDEFYSDISMDGMLYASILRSPVPKGKLLNIALESLPEGYCFFGINDIPQSKTIKMPGTEIPVFCGEDISFLGQPLGIIVGPSRKTVRKLCKELKISIDEHFIYEEKQSQTSETQNLLAIREINSGEKYEKNESDIEIEQEWESEITPQNYFETNGAICWAQNSKLSVFAPNVWTSNLRKTLSEVTGFKPENIFITRTKLPNANTNILWLNSLICCQCAVAAIKTQKPVKLEFTRKEQTTFAENTSAVKILHKTTVDRSGMLKCMDIQIHVNGGAYNPFAQEIADRLAISSVGLYDCPNIRISSKIYKSHSIPSSIDFSIIDSKAFFAVENQMNKIASVTGIDPIELREKNISKNIKKQYSPFFVENSDAGLLLHSIEKKSVFLRKYASYKVSGNQNLKIDRNSPFAPPLRGIGIALGYEGTGYLASKFITTKVSVEATFTQEKKLFIKALPPSANIWKIWQAQAASILGIPEENIINDTFFDDEKEPENPQTANATISITTQLIKKACESLKKKSADSLPQTVKKSFVSNGKKKWDKENFRGFPFSSTSLAAMIVELELDPSTFKDTIRGIWFIIDAGKVLNKEFAESSVKNAVRKNLQGLVVDEPHEVENINIQFLPSDSAPKQIGEVVSSLLPAAYSSALSQVAGRTVDALPIQTDTIYHLTEKNRNEQVKK